MLSGFIQPMSFSAEHKYFKGKCYLSRRWSGWLPV